MAEPAPKALTVEEFVAGLEGDERVELWDGQVVAMVGGTAAAFRIARNVLTTLHARLRGGRCEAFGDGMLVEIDAVTALVPDASIVCNRPEPQARALTEPVVIVEVLSPSTEPADRGYKWQAYRTLASLQHYLLVAQDRPQIEIFSREEGGSWRYQVIEGDLVKAIVLSPPGIELTLGEIYEEVAFPAPEPPPAAAVPEN